ncbi:MAG TPA: autotransporter assembly complex family protein [Candidatus Omnitrophota bacterium]|nr:autotransporter assembly complex family protein [Candidatus Omnitrophota bacterium]
MRFLLWLLLAALLPIGAQAQGVPYRAEVLGIEGDGLRGRVEEASRLIQLADEEPASMVALTRRAEADIERVREVLRSEGYYAGKVAFEIDEGQTPVPVRLLVEPGPPFLLQSYEIETEVPPGSPGPQPVDPAALGLEIGTRARAEPVVAARSALLRNLAEQGFPLAEVEDDRVVVDHATHTMRVTVRVRSGRQARFGPVTVTGLENVREKYVRRRLTWQQGDVFSVSKVEALREALVNTRLFTSMRIETAKETDPEGLLPVTIELREAKHRSIGFGLTWSSNEGFGGHAFWEHRNVDNGGERLRTALVASEVRNALDVTYREPDFLAADQNLLLAGTAEEQRTDAFTTRTVGGSAGVEWNLSRRWTASASLALDRTFEEENEQTTDFTLVSVPLEVRHDSTDDLLDPTRGNRMRALVRPFFEPPGTSGFTQFDLSDSHYWQVLAEPRVIAAAWGRVGTIRGASFQEVPADRRFYVGGGGSVRAFGYQMAGPVDADEDPTGGLSALAFGGELRIKVSEDVGLVPFVEAGRADIAKWPSGPLFWGGGLGVRYHTPVGPVRADIAVPINGREGIDDDYVVYLSLGQAF